MDSLLRASFLLLVYSVATVRPDVVVLNVNKNALIGVLAGSISLENLRDLKFRITTLESHLDTENSDVNLPNQETNTSYSDALSQRNRRYVDEIVHYIKRTEFQKAEKRVLEMNDTLQIPKIVRKVYARSDTNFKLLLDFSKDLSNGTYAFYFLKSTIDELKANDHFDQTKLLIIAEWLTRNPEMLTNDEGVAELFKVFIFDSIKPFAAETLIMAIETNDTLKAEHMYSVIALLYNTKPKVYDEILEQVLESTYETVEHRRILEIIVSSKNLPLAIVGIRALFNKIIVSGDRNESAVIYIARSLSRLQMRDEFTNLSPTISNSFNEMVNKLPTCARNLYFSSSVCLSNLEIEGYVLADNQPHIVSSSYRGVTKDPTRLFYPRKRGDAILFECGTTRSKFSLLRVNRRPERTSTGSWHYVTCGLFGAVDEAIWEVQLADEYCYLKSIYNDEYLISSPNEQHILYTTELANRDEKRFLWQITACVK